jgi:hypothetical protein
MILDGRNKKQAELKLEDMAEKKTRNMMKGYNISPSYLMLIAITTVTNTGPALVIT